jgi:hypothetical protein
MIDYQVYRKFHSSADAFSFHESDLAPFDDWPKEIEAANESTAELSPANLMLLPPGIHGFFLKDKKWGEHNRVRAFLQALD